MMRSLRRQWQISKNVRPSRRWRGITSIDLLVTVLIMGVTSAVALPRFSGALASSRVEAAAQHLVADLNRARASAIRTSQTCTATFQISPAGYSLTNVAALHGQGDRAVNLLEAGFDVSMTVSFDGNDFVQWNVYGMPFTGANPDPLISGQVVVSSGNVSRTVVIDALTGKASVQ